MTIASVNRSDNYAGDGIVLVFAYNFRILDQSHLVVTLTDALGVDTIQTISTHYTVDGVRATSGNVTMITEPATGETLKIERVVPLLQSTDLRNAGTFFPETHEDALDFVTMALQQIEAAADSNTPASYTTATRPSPTLNQAGKTIRLINPASPEQRQVCVLSSNGTDFTWVTVATGAFS